MELKNNLAVTFTASLTLDESEARALDALVGYGTDAFLEAFYKKMGEAYLMPHEKGLRRLFKKIQEEMRPVLATIDKARETLREANSKGWKDVK